MSLLNRTRGSWGTVERWRARHEAQGGPDGVCVYVAEASGVIVGCLQATRCVISLGRGISVPAAIDGDLAVEQEYRGRGVAELLYQESSREFRALGIALRIGYSEPGARVQYYCRALGYETGFSSTEAWKKHFDSQAFRTRLFEALGVNPEEPDPGRGPVVAISVAGLDPVRLRLGAGIAPAPRAIPTFTLLSDQRLLSVFTDLSPGPARWRSLLDLWRRGGLQVHGWIGFPRVLLWTIKTWMKRSLVFRT